VSDRWEANESTQASYDSVACDFDHDSDRSRVVSSDKHDYLDAEMRVLCPYNCTANILKIKYYHVASSLQSPQRLPQEVSNSECNAIYRHK